MSDFCTATAKSNIDANFPAFDEHRVYFTD